MEGQKEEATNSQPDLCHQSSGPRRRTTRNRETFSIEFMLGILHLACDSFIVGLVMPFYPSCAHKPFLQVLKGGTRDRGMDIEYLYFLWVLQNIVEDLLFIKSPSGGGGEVWWEEVKVDEGCGSCLLYGSMVPGELWISLQIFIRIWAL